ncbi:MULTISPECIES: NUDIX hydrolase [Microbacterium]|uniref:NUDIX hydrolase n=1 Tax=Microbacterium TaxID=33882 RepID=UPI00146A094B|nr:MULTISPECIES: NUDIX hydrolase [Microbacterium]
MSDIADPIQITRGGVARGLGYALVCSGYLVEDDKVLLVHHRGFDKWVPPGGHIEAGDMFHETAAREVKEETGLDVEVLSATPSLLNDDNATALPGPFYVDVEREGFHIPAIVQFYFVRRVDREAPISAQLSEVHEVGWFDAAQIEQIPTFEQVRMLSRYALEHHPDVQSSTMGAINS